MGNPPFDGPCIAIHRTRISAAKFSAGSLEARPEWSTENVKAHSENAKSSKFSEYDGFPNLYTYTPDYSRGVEGIVGNYIKAFGLFIPLDRPVYIKVADSTGYRDCRAQIVDIDTNGTVYFFPLESQRDYGGYLHWRNLHDGAMQLPPSYITGFNFTPDAEIKASENEIVLFPERRKELYDVASLPAVEVNNHKIPLNQELEITTVRGEIYRGTLIFKSYIDSLLLRRTDDLFSGGCHVINCDDIELIDIPSAFGTRKSR